MTTKTRMTIRRTTGDEVFHFVGQELGHEMEGIAQEHEKCHGLVGGAPLDEYLWLKLTEYLMEHLFCNAEGGGTEEHPTGCNKVEEAPYKLWYIGHSQSQPNVKCGRKLTLMTERRRSRM